MRVSVWGGGRRAVPELARLSALARANVLLAPHPSPTMCPTLCLQCGMEMYARYAHKVLWHDFAPGWALHKSHHMPRTGPFEVRPANRTHAPPSHDGWLPVRRLPHQATYVCMGFPQQLCRHRRSRASCWWFEPASRQGWIQADLSPCYVLPSAAASPMPPPVPLTTSNTCPLPASPHSFAPSLCTPRRTTTFSRWPTACPPSCCASTAS